MSEYGFEIQNIYGQVVADTNYPVYTPLSYGTFSIGQSLNVWGFTDVWFPQPVPVSMMPQFLFQPPVDVYGYPKIVVHTHHFDGTNITGVRLSSYWYSQSISRAVTVNYIVACPISYANVSNSDYGVSAFDAYGGLTFHSGKNLITIKYIGQHQVGQFVSHPLITGSRYVGISGLAGIQVTPAYISRGRAYSGTVYYGGIRYNSETSLYLDWNIMALNKTTESANQPMPVSVIVCELGA